ncbi:hypothetical protein ACX80W_03690 [Arthrobacter sp. TMN-37]
MSATASRNANTGRRQPADHPPQGDEQRVRIRAARLRLTTDRKLGKETPSWVKQLAKKPL